MTYSSNTNLKYSAKALHSARNYPLTGELGYRLVLQILCVSAFLSLIATTVQLFVGYERDKNEIISTSLEVEKSFGSGFEDALWNYNFQLVDALIEGVYNKTNVEYVQITTPEDRRWALGSEYEGLIFRTLEFYHEQQLGQKVVVGEMTLGLSAASATRRLFAQMWIVALSNFAKAMIASIAILALFERHVGRHLRRVAEHVSTSAWQDGNERIDLDRGGGKQSDDIDGIVQAIHSAKQRAQSDFERLEREVSQRRATESELVRRSDALEKTRKEQAEFTYAISHDLKSPANTIKMLVQELKFVEQSPVQDQSAELLDDIEYTTDRMITLIDDILIYANSIEKNSFDDEIDLAPLVAKVCKDLQGEISTANAVINVGSLASIQGNAAQIRMLVQNLLANAIKFRAKDRAPVVSLNVMSRDGYDVIRVEDNGIGIASDHFDRIFGLFQRLHSHAAYEGSGLGLALCSRIAANHGGEISVVSTVGVGTSFEITLKKGRK